MTRSSSSSIDYFKLPRRIWRTLKKCLPKYKKPTLRGRPRASDRGIANAIWYVLWTGCQWKALHRSWFGMCASTVHARFQAWQRAGTFNKVMTRFDKRYSKKCGIRWKWQVLDSKSCTSPLGGDGSGRNLTDRGKLGSKIHLLVDKRGAPLAVTVTGANRHDSMAATTLIASIVLARPVSEQHLCADKAYDAAIIREVASLKGYTPHIKVNSRRPKRIEHTEAPITGLGECTSPAKRWVIERTLSWLCKRRSIKTRWAKSLDNWLALEGVIK